MESGRVTAEGTFSDLTTRPGLFRDLWLLQRDRIDPSAQEDSAR
jgi:ATP-binding cassette subfamily B protein